MGGGDIPEVIKLDLLTEEQKDALGQLLTGTMASLGKLELGTPYGGALESSYSPYTPTYKTGGGGGGGDRDRDRKRRRESGGVQGLSVNGGTTGAGATGVEGSKTVIRNGTVVRKDAGGTTGGETPTEGRTVLGEILDIVQRRQAEPTGIPPAAGMPPAGDEQTMMRQMLESILSPSPMPVSSGMMPISPVNVPPASDVLPPEAQPVSPISQLLTQPFVQPFREGMTGNYPGPIRRR